MNPLLDPELELVQILPTGNVTIATRCTWLQEEYSVESIGIPPANGNEPTILIELEPGTYSVAVKGVGDTEGVANVEIYDFSAL